MLSRSFGLPDPKAILKCLTNAKVDFVLVGAHGISGWTGRHRATEDVDVVVKQRHHKRAIKAVLETFPHLKAKDLPVVTSIYDPTTEQVFVDLMKPNQPIFKVLFKHSRTVGDYRIPTLEMAIVTKFCAMVSMNRDPTDKAQDGVDFARMVQNNPKSLNRKKVAALADIVYLGGGVEILKLVDDAAAGKRLEF